MRWSRMLAQLKHPPSASLSFPSLNVCRASISNLSRKRGPQENPSSGQASGTPPHSQGQARAWSQSAAICKTGTAASLPGNASSSQSQTARTVATSQSSVKPSPNSSTAEEKPRSSASDSVKPKGKRKESLAQVSIKPVETSRGKAKASSKASATQACASGKIVHEASASSPSPADKRSVDISKNSRIAVNQQNGEALLVNERAVGNINYSEDGIASARVSETSPTHKAEPRASSSGSRPHTENISIPPLGERSSGVGGALNENPESRRCHVSVGDEETTSKDVSACTPGSSPSGASTDVNDKDQAGSKKPSFTASFPVRVLCDWWFSCYAQVYRPYYTSLVHPFNKIYVWLAAYQRVHFDVTGHYADGQSAETLREQLLRLLNDVLAGKFRWADKKILYLPMPVGHNEESSPIFQDRVVTEVMYLVLEPIFEARFSSRSHGFRPGRDAHTALRAVRRSFLGCTWFIRGTFSVVYEDKYASYLVESALKVLRDTRLASLLKSGFLGRMPEQQGSTSGCMFSDQDSYSKLRNLLCNVFLDQLDRLMDEQISSFHQRNQPFIQSSLNSLFKLAKVKKEKPRKLEYIRYGAEILLACNGTREEAELVQNSISSYFKENFSMDVGKRLTISHISDGIEFLDHVISLKTSHPLLSRRRASNASVFEKRAHRIRLSISASREYCAQYLNQIETPKSLQHIEEILSVLDSWYCCAENRSKVMEYCKLTLCHAYAKGVVKNCEEGSIDLDGKVKEAMDMVGNQRKSGDLDRESVVQDFFWIPEHEYCLRDHVWLQSQSPAGLMAAFKTTRVVSPQQYMPQILWRSLGETAHPSNGGDGSWEAGVPMHRSQGYLAETKLEDVAESAG